MINNNNNIINNMINNIDKYAIERDIIEDELENYRIRFNNEILDKINKNDEKIECAKYKLNLASLEYDRYMDGINKLKMCSSEPISISKNPNKFIESYDCDHFWILLSYPEYQNKYKSSILMCSKEISGTLHNMTYIIDYRTSKKEQIMSDIKADACHNKENLLQLRELTENIKLLELEEQKYIEELINLRATRDTSQNDILANNNNNNNNTLDILLVRANDNIEILDIIGNIKTRRLDIKTTMSFSNLKRFEINLEKNRNSSTRNTIQKRPGFPIIYADGIKFKKFKREMQLIHLNQLEKCAEYAFYNVVRYKELLKVLMEEYKELDCERCDINKNADYRRLLNYYQKKLKNLCKKI